MKRTLYSLLLVFLLSCGSSRQANNPDATYYYLKDGNLLDGALIAVRDSSLLVRKYYGFMDTTAGKDYIVIPTSSVDFIEFGYHDHAGGGILGFLIGALAGMGTVFGIADAHGSDEIESTLLVSIGFYAGGILGCNAGCYIDEQGSRYYPYRKDDLKYIRTRSAYPDGEPDELKRIK